jgi:hypothetical protein
MVVEVVEKKVELVTQVLLELVSIMKPMKQEQTAAAALDVEETKESIVMIKEDVIVVREDAEIPIVVPLVVVPFTTVYLEQQVEKVEMVD